jgi:hypothetical protein
MVSIRNQDVVEAAPEPERAAGSSPAVLGQGWSADKTSAAHSPESSTAQYPFKIWGVLAMILFPRGAGTFADRAKRFTSR